MPREIKNDRLSNEQLAALIRPIVKSELRRSDGVSSEILPPGAAGEFLSHDGTTPVWVDRTPDVQVFTANGTWTKPAGAKTVRVYVWGAGGGGGSGRRAATGNRTGGGGGEGGGFSFGTYKADDLAATEAVTIGTGGTGGAAQTVDTSNGNPGTAGTDSDFGGMLYARGGNFGFGGASASVVQDPNAQGAGGHIRGAARSSTSVSNAVGFSSGAAGGGGSGGGISTGGTASAGGAGGTCFPSPDAGGSAGALDTGGGAGQGPATSEPTLSGTGGGGGGAYSASGAGAGGAGGAPGGGGAGGGASINGFNSGAGGDGARGQVTVITEF